MNKSKKAIGLFLFPYIMLGQYTDVINSNKPGESFSAFSVRIP